MLRAVADKTGGGFPGAFTTLTVTGQASFADGTAAAPSVRIGDEQNGFYSSAANTLDLTLNGVRQFQFNYTASAVDFLSTTGSSAAFPGLYASGASTNVNMLLVSKGTGGIYAATNGGTVQFLVTHTASAVNYPGTTGSATGAPVSFFAVGSDPNIDFAVFPKGTGVLRFGTHSALAGETVTGYITVKDSAGNSRKLAVVS